jgi:hypothetical protein
MSFSCFANSAGFILAISLTFHVFLFAVSISRLLVEVTDLDASNELLAFFYLCPVSTLYKSIARAANFALDVFSYNQP